MEASMSVPDPTAIAPDAQLERTASDEECSTPTCTNTCRVERGVLRCPGNPLDGKVLVPGLRLCDECRARRDERAAQLAAQREVAAAELPASLRPPTEREQTEPPSRYHAIPPDFRTAVWDRVPAGKHPELLADWAKDPESIYLFGGSGVGKSMLVARIVMDHIDLMPSSRVAWFNVSILLDRIRRSINKPERTERLIEEACEADVLVLDDLGAEAPSRWTLDRLYVVLEERIEQQRITVITSNYMMSDLRAHLLNSKEQDPGLPQAVDRLVSRIRGKHRILLPLQGRDQRIHGAA
jgi:hypothetical protein